MPNCPPIPFTQVYPIVVQQVRLDLENEEIQVTQ